MIKFSDLKPMGTRAVGRGILISKNYSPEVLTTVGVIGVVAAAVLASRATLKLEPAVDKINDGLEVAKDRSQLATSIDHKKALTYVYVRGVADIGKLYGPAITLGLGSIVCIVSANGIMRKRNMALVAAYKAVETSFSAYRERVIEEFGEEKDLEYRRGFRTEKSKGKDGKKKELTTVDADGLSQYSRLFDSESSPNWVRTPEYNLLFVRCQQNYANDLLHARGHIFLNEIYDRLGFERTPAGQVVGWRIDDEGDNYIDFGIYDFMNDKARKFVDGYERSLLLDFNVNGVIYDRI